MAIATCWNTESIERSPTAMLRPSKMLWVARLWIACWNRLS